MADEFDRAPNMPEGIAPDTPNAARMYDYFLGGRHNFEVDQVAAKRAIATWPEIRQLSMDNRRWMARTIRHALATGVRQFLDLGSGVPTVGNVHQIVRDNLPAGERASVVYVDYEHVAVTEAARILRREGAHGWASIIREDVRNPEAILEHVEARRLIDFTQPVSLQMIALVHFLGPDDRPYQLTATYRDRLASGSRLAISQVAVDDAAPEDANAVRRVVDTQYRNTQNPLWLRNKDELRAFFGDWQLVEPGIVHLPDWRPELEPEPIPATNDARLFGWCGVAEKP